VSICFFIVFPHVPYTYTVALEKLSLHFLRKRRHDLDALFLFGSIVASNLAFPFCKMLAFVFLPAILGTSHYLVLVPLINTVLLLDAHMLPTRWVKISTYLLSEPFLSIIFILINLKLLMLSVQNPIDLCCVILVTSYLCFICLFVYLFVNFLHSCVFSSSIFL
jgi:hypothetical protein